MAKVDGLSVGAKGLRGPAPNAAEVKQRFVQAAYQDLSFGRMLVERIVERGRRICYENGAWIPFGTGWRRRKRYTARLDLSKFRPTTSIQIQMRFIMTRCLPETAQELERAEKITKLKSR